MYSPPLSARTDIAPSDGRRPQALVISVHPDGSGARAAARWAEQLGSAAAETLLSTDERLEERVRAAQRVLVLDPGRIAAKRGFGVRASARERLALIARLSDHQDHVTWATTASQAARWVEGH